MGSIMQRIQPIRFATIVFVIIVSTAATSAAVNVQEVVYRTTGSLTFKGYLAKPEGPGPFPVVVYNHGGLGNIVGGPPAKTARALAESGYVGFSPIRRKTVSLHGHLDDVLAAVEFVKNLDCTDANDVAIMGFSRGALLTYMAVTTGERFSAAIMMAPARGRGAIDRFLSRAERVDVPALILVAKNDDVSSSYKLAAALRAAEKEVELIVYPPYGQDGHRMFFEVGDYWKDVTGFLRANPGES